MSNPPLGIWLEAAFLKFFGSAPETLVILARLYATALIVLIFAMGWCLAGADTAAFCVLSLLLFSGFWFEAQNPMLEMPFAVAFAFGMLGCVVVPGWAAGCLIACGLCAALLIKGPPALALLPIVAWSAWRLDKPRRTVLVWAVVVALLGVVLVAIQLGQQYVESYLAQQVAASMFGWRDSHAIHGPFFYGVVLWRWYGAALLCVPLAIFSYVQERRLGKPHRLLLFELGWLAVMVLLIGFGLIPKKNAWYIHPCMTGFALMMGATAASLLDKRCYQPLACLVVCCMCLLLAAAAIVPQWWKHKNLELVAIHTLPAPVFVPGEVREIAHCGSTGIWKATHLFALKWGAILVDCQKPARYVFDGKQLVLNR